MEIPTKPARPNIRLIPTPLWGLSLAGLCTGSCWEAIRKAELERSDRCIFGDPADPLIPHSGPIHVHERWRYKDGTATLEALWPVCGKCHDMMHPGRMLAVHGQLGFDHAVRRYARVFSISDETALDEAERALVEHKDNSRIARWTIDISVVEPRFPLKPKKSAHLILARHNWVGQPFGIAHHHSDQISR